MAWEGLSVAELCRALADPARGAMTPDQWIAHIQTPLVVWAWSPGTDVHAQARSTPPLMHNRRNHAAAGFDRRELSKSLTLSVQ
jgi:hypothetical protein